MRQYEWKLKIQMQGVYLWVQSWPSYKNPSFTASDANPPLKSTCFSRVHRQQNKDPASVSISEGDKLYCTKEIRRLQAFAEELIFHSFCLSGIQPSFWIPHHTVTSNHIRSSSLSSFRCNFRENKPQQMLGLSLPNLFLIDFYLLECLLFMYFFLSWAPWQSHSWWWYVWCKKVLCSRILEEIFCHED